MKKGMVVSLLAGWFLLMPGWWIPSAHAGVLEWPVISQVVNIVKCIVADTGKITTSLVTHATAFTVETAQTVGECLTYTTAQVTPGIIPDHSH